MKKYKVGDTVSGVITGITDYGVFVKLDDEYTGMVHISEISDRYISSLEKMYVLEETIESKVLEIDEEKKQIKLSSKEFNAKWNKLLFAIHSDDYYEIRCPYCNNKGCIEKQNSD